MSRTIIHHYVPTEEQERTVKSCYVDVDPHTPVDVAAHVTGLIHVKVTDESGDTYVVYMTATQAAHLADQVTEVRSRLAAGALEYCGTVGTTCHEHTTDLGKQWLREATGSE